MEMLHISEITVSFLLLVEISVLRFTIILRMEIKRGFHGQLTIFCIPKDITAIIMIYGVEEIILNIICINFKI